MQHHLIRGLSERQLVGPRRAKIESTQGVPVARSSAKSETHLNPHRMAVSDAASVMQGTPTFIAD